MRPETITALRGQPHCVYRVFDAADHLLYVGCTRDPERRKDEHRRSKPWYPRAARWEHEWHPDFGTARRAEGEAIRAETPECNRHASGGYTPSNPGELYVPTRTSSSVARRDVPSGGGDANRTLGSRVTPTRAPRGDTT